MDPDAPEAEQSAVSRTFSNRSATREDLRRLPEKVSAVPPETLTSINRSSLEPNAVQTGEGCRK